MDWQDSLEAEIPIDRLQDAFAGAVRGHSSTFPINAFEVLMAWREIASAEQAERRQRYDQERMEREKNLPFVPPPEGLLESIDDLLRRKSLSAYQPCEICGSKYCLRDHRSESFVTAKDGTI
jgi:hypothetical protein